MLCYRRVIVHVQLVLFDQGYAELCCVLFQTQFQSVRLWSRKSVIIFVQPIKQESIGNVADNNILEISSDCQALLLLFHICRSSVHQNWNWNTEPTIRTRYLHDLLWQFLSCLTPEQYSQETFFGHGQHVIEKDNFIN